MVVMHPGRPCRRIQRRRDLLVFEALLGAEQKDFALQPGKLAHTHREPSLYLTRFCPLVRISGLVRESLIERYHLVSRRSPPVIFQHVAADGQEPGTELALPPESIHRPKCADQRFLHQIFQIGARGPRPCQKARQGARVTPDQLGRRLLISPAPRGDEGRVRGRSRGWHGSDRLGLGHWLQGGRRASCVDIKEGVPSQFERLFEPMRPYDERLDHLLAQAARVFAEKGYHSTTMRDLSAASGMSLAGMYYYTRGKEDLLALIQERCFTRVLAGAEAAVAAAHDPAERLQAFIRHHVTFFAHHMAEMKVLSHEPARGVAAIKRRYVDLLERLLKDAAPDEAAVDRSAAAYVLFGMMNWIYNWYDPAGKIDPPRLAEDRKSVV